MDTDFTVYTSEQVREIKEVAYNDALNDLRDKLRKAYIIGYRNGVKREPGDFPADKQAELRYP